MIWSHDRIASLRAPKVSRISTLQKMPRVIAVTNQKGGVGKTTTAINLAASLALADQRVLVVDLDPQGNLTSGLGLRGQRALGGTIYDAAHGRPAANGRRLHPADCGRQAFRDSVRRQPHRRRDRARVAARARTAAAATARTDPQRLRSHLHRLPAVARPADLECAGRRRRRTDSAPLRVLRARRAGRARLDAAARARLAELVARHRRRAY